MNDNLFELFARAFRDDPGRVLLATPAGQALTWTDAQCASARLAGLLAGAGLSPGDRVTVQVQKSPDAVWLYLACLRGGFVYHPLNDAYRRDELAFLVADAQPGFAVCDPANETLFRDLAGRACAVMTLDGDGAGTLAEAARSLPAEDEVYTASADAAAILLYTSGTTGRPKGAVITHGNLSANAAALVGTWGFTREDRLLHALPLYHAHGLFVGLGCAFASGARLIFLKQFDASQVIAGLPHCTVMMGVPTYYSRLLREPALDRATCRNMRLFISGSAPLPPEIFREFRDRTGHEILERYGMTETGMNTSNPLHGERRPGSVGKSLPGVSLRVVDTSNRPLAPGAIGEVQLRGANVFAGYWRAEQATADAFTADGWFRTGDQGSLDENGYLTIAGRSKDLVITGGLNVYPREVEIALDSLDGIEESAVIGAPHPDFGEGVLAVVVPSTHVMLDEAAIIAELKQRMAGYKVPKRIIPTQSLPRNSMGKVEKNTLRHEHCQVFMNASKEQ